MASRGKLLALGLAIALIAVVPYTRRVVLFHVLEAVPPYGHTWSVRETERDVPRNPGEALVIAYRNAREVESINVYWEVVEKHPTEPALYANMLRYAARWGPISKIDRPEIRDGSGRSEDDRLAWKPLAGSPELDKVEQAIEMGKKLEPDNCYFDLFEAVVRFAQGRDSEALAAIHGAAGKNDFDDHTRDESLALLEDLRRRTPTPIYWLDPMPKMIVACSVLSAQAILFRQVVQLAAWHAEQSARSEEYDRALAIMTDLVRVGGIMRDNSGSVVSGLVGVAIQKIGIRGASRGLTAPPAAESRSSSEDPATRAQSAPAQLSNIESSIGTRLRPDDWRVLRDSLARSDEFVSRARTYSAKMLWGKSVLTGSALSRIAGSLLLQSLVLGVFCLATWLWLSKRGRTSLRGLGPNRWTIWLLAILPPAAALTFIVLANSVLSSGLPGTVIWQLRIPVLAWLMPVLVVVIVGLRTRVVPAVGRFDTFLGRLRMGSAFAIQATLLLYVLTTAISLPVIARANGYVDQMVRNEVQMLWQSQPWEGKQDRQ